jgi:menaquinone-dependent protoporphyrinogen oxidase
MGKILIAYASKTGTTADVAAMLAKRLACAADLYDLRRGQRAQAPDLCAYDAVVLGTAMYMGRPMRAMAAYCNANEAALVAKPLYLFTCGIAEEAEEQPYLNKTLSERLTAHARAYRHLGGELRLNRMSPFARFAMGQFLKTHDQKPGLNVEAIEALCQIIKKDEETI